MSGCAIGKGVRPLYESDGKQVYEAKCNGTIRTIGDCYELAGKACNGKFKEIDRGQDNHYFLDRNQVTAVNNRTFIFICQ